jgi:lipoprotein-anchoring transpeptidase ErfK/SrfK
MAPGRTPGVRGLLWSLGTSGLGVLAGGGLALGGLALAGAATAHTPTDHVKIPAAHTGRPAADPAVPPAGTPVPAEVPVQAVPVSRHELARLPEATTYGTTGSAPVDLTAPSDGTVVTVATSVPAFAGPGGPAVARIPATELGQQTWLPVLDHQPGWARVRLPSRPNGATAWVPDARLRTARTPWAVRIDLLRERMTVTRDGAPAGSWAIGQGAAGTATPVGETFLVASFTDRSQSYSPVIFATGSHSETLDSYGGGPGTVALHGWPTRSGRLGKVSHGCVRVPPAALAQLRRMPLGTPISITSSSRTKGTPR